MTSSVSKSAMFAKPAVIVSSTVVVASSIAVASASIGRITVPMYFTSKSKPPVSAARRFRDGGIIETKKLDGGYSGFEG